MPTKQDTIDAIFELLREPSPRVGRGSTEPKSVFVRVVTRLGLDAPTTASKPELAEAIARAAAVPWDADCDARASPSGGGSTVTKKGLQRVLEAVESLLGRRTPARAARLPVGTKYRTASARPRSEPEEFTINWAQVEESNREHAATQEELRAFLERRRVTPLSPRVSADPQFDIAWRSRGSLYVCEVKCVNVRNSRHQFRLGLGQALEYRSRLLGLGEDSVVAIVVASSALFPYAVATAQSVGAVATWPARFEQDLAHLAI